MKILLDKTEHANIKSRPNSILANTCVSLIVAKYDVRSLVAERCKQDPAWCDMKNLCTLIQLQINYSIVENLQSWQF